MLELVELAELRPAPAGPAVRRSAAAGRPGPRAHQPAAGAAAGRAARRARPQAAPADADRAQADPDRGRAHLRPRHPRPGGGHDDGRHGRGDERRAGSSSWGRRRSCTRTRRTTFVANFLGQSNLVAGDGVERRRRRAAPGRPRHPDRWPTRPARGRPSGEVWLGVRPEKVLLSASRGGRPRPDVNILADGVVTDVSFVGVSTQYLVRMPWGQELMVFEQNTGGWRAVPHRRRGRPALASRRTPSSSTPPRTPSAGAPRSEDAVSAPAIRPDRGRPPAADAETRSAAAGPVTCCCPRRALAGCCSS